MAGTGRPVTIAATTTGRPVDRYWSTGRRYRPTGRRYWPTGFRPVDRYRRPVDAAPATGRPVPVDRSSRPDRSPVPRRPVAGTGRPVSRYRRPVGRYRRPVGPVAGTGSHSTVTLLPVFMLAVYHPCFRCLPPLPMCPEFRKGDCQPFTLQKLTTGYKPITSSLQAAGLVIPRKACYKGFVKHYEGASFVTKLVTKLVMLQCGCIGLRLVGACRCPTLSSL